VAKRKLDHVHAASTISDLGKIPGNRLEALVGDRVEQYSIRVNDQWRICFRWVEPDAFEVEIVDYH
jgi:proteic killer suppression protein